MTKPDYNGRSNRSTWNAALWLNNDESAYRMKQAVVDRYQNHHSVNRLAAGLRELCRDLWVTKTPDGCPLSAVNFKEIAKSEIEG